MIIPDKNSYSISFVKDQDYRYELQIIDDTDTICCSFKIPISLIDEILMFISEKSIYGFTRDYPVVTIDVPLSSLVYKYTIIMFNEQEFMIIKQLDLTTHRTVNEYYIRYENI